MGIKGKSSTVDTNSGDCDDYHGIPSLAVMPMGQEVK